MSNNDTNTPPRVDEQGSIVSTEPRRQLTPTQKIGVAVLLLAVFLSFIWIGQLNKTTREVKQPEVAMTAGGALIAPPAAPPTLPTQYPTGLPMPNPASSASLLPSSRHEMTAAESPIFAFAGGGGIAVGQSVAASAASLSNIAAPLPPISQPSALGNLLKPTLLTGSKARLLPHPDMTITMGTMIPCTLQTAIDSQLAGYVKCVLPQDVRSTTGNVVLLDRGTIVVGEIGRGLVQGQDRVFVLWDRAETPDHAVIELASPGTDELGRSGLPGRVNNHWWDRFGSAILLSVIQGGLQAGSGLAASSGTTGGTFFNSFQSNGTNVSDTALQATINIPPTLEKNQGDNVAIFVAKDLDFSDVYNLRVIGRPYGQ